MVNYSNFHRTDDHAYNLCNAIRYCKEHGEDGLIFPKGRYDFYPERSAEHLLHISNHDIYGEKRIAFLLKDMENFMIDGGGSDFFFHSDMVPFALLGSQNITLKNFSINYETTMAFCLKVTAAGEDGFDFCRLFGSDCYIQDKKLYICEGNGRDEVLDCLCLLNNGQNKEMIPESRDFLCRALRFEDLGRGNYRVYKGKEALEVRVGNILSARALSRPACNIAIDRCRNTHIAGVTMYKSYGMGVLAEKSENITIDKMTVKADEGEYFSLNADATHFVNCKGLVKVTNSSFSEQQDDALNIHGVFNPVVDKTESYVLIKYVHPQAKGLAIYESGDAVAALDPKTLIPKCKRKVIHAEVLNMNYTKLYIEGGTDGIEVGDIFEDLTWSCDLIFENNRVRNNRARGMLIATKGKVEIRNNYFNTPGIAILFESDCKYWFESGGTNAVVIQGNQFDNCCFTHGNWGKNVIALKPREEFDGKNYYHKYIEVSHNEFTSCKRTLLAANNVEKFLWCDNTVQNAGSEELLTFKNCGQIEKDL